LVNVRNVTQDAMTSMLIDNAKNTTDSLLCVDVLVAVCQGRHAIVQDIPFIVKGIQACFINFAGRDWRKGRFGKCWEWALGFARHSKIDHVELSF